MSASWCQAVAVLCFAVVIATAKVKSNSVNEDLLRELARDRSDCTSRICRRNVKKSPEIVEKDAISQLSDSFKENKNALEKRGCLSWKCNVGRTIRNVLNFDEDKTIDQERRAAIKRVFKPRRCLTWLCNKKLKRTAKAIDNEQEIISKHEKKSKCLSSSCQRKRANEKNDSKRLLLKQVLIVRKQRGDHDECLSWDCKRGSVSDKVAEKREADRSFDSEGRGDRFMEYLMERSFPRFPEEWSSTGK